MANEYLLTVMTFLPAAAGLGLCLVRSERLVKQMALIATLAVAALGVWLWMEFDPAKGDQLQFTIHKAWIKELGISFSLGIDGIALTMVLLTALLGPLCVACSWDSIRDRARSFFIALLFLESGILGVFCAADLFLFYVFWEAMLVPMYLLIGVWGGPRRIYAAAKFIIYTVAGSLLMLLAVLYCYGLERTFDIMTLQERLPEALSVKAQLWLFGAFAVAFAIKVPVFPFHTWLPDAHVEAPTAGSVILAGVLLKMGTYGFLRFAMPFFPAATARMADVMIALAVVSIVYGALMSLAQTDIKRLIAYSSVSHLGFVMLGLFSFTLEGGQGGVMQMVNHGLSTGALFLLVGMIYDRTHQRGVGDFGGLARTMPVYAAVFLVITLSSIGLPGLNGFVGEFLVIAGAFSANRLAGAAAATGVILGAVYMLKLYRDMFHGPERAWEHGKPADATRRELAMLAPILAFVVILGVVPGPLLRRTEPAVRKVMEAVRLSKAAVDDGSGN